VSSGYKYSIENFRGLAIIFVVFSHFGSFHNLGPLGKFTYFVVANATAWFVFISGYLFFYIEQRRFDYCDYLLKKAKYVVLPYLLLSIPALAAGFYLARPQLLGLSGIGYVGWSLAVGGGTVVGPMWFIPMIVLFFVLSPVFNRLARSWLLYPLGFLGMGLAIFTWRPAGGLNPFLSFLHFLGFYLLGIMFAVMAPKFDKISKEIVSTVIVIGGIAGFIVTYYYGYHDNGSSGFFDGFGVFNALQFGKLCLLLSVFFTFERFFTSKNKVLGYFASVSFGLFFVHGFYMAAYSRAISYLRIGDPVLQFLGEIFVVFILAVITVAIVKFVLKKKSRYVIGC
jgi:peptidoglycan/LPS O-acetylase OafA/YrhL